MARHAKDARAEKERARLKQQEKERQAKAEEERKRQAKKNNDRAKALVRKRQQKGLSPDEAAELQVLQLKGFSGKN